MKIAFIGGTGNLGFGLAVRCAKEGHAVVIGSREAAKAQEAAQAINSMVPGANAEGAGNISAAKQAQLIVLALPFAAHADLLPPLMDACAGKVVLDTTVPMRYGKPPEYQVPEAGSAAQGVQALLSGARVVSGLHTVSAASLADLNARLDCDALVCGDDAEAKTCIIDLFSRFIPRVIDAGALAGAQGIERLTPLVIGLNQLHKKKHIGIKLSNF